jgi:N-acetylglutamate synthase-like GNAT family acetyltransferase
VSAVAIIGYDSPPAEAVAVVDRGLGEANAAAAPLHEVAPVACIARDGDGRVIGGAVGRWWGECAELQQLWVQEPSRRSGIGSALVREFLALARARGCKAVFLETFSFQAPGFYRALGFRVAYENKLFPHGIVKLHLVKRLDTVRSRRGSLPSEDMQ